MIENSFTRKLSGEVHVVCSVCVCVCERERERESERESASVLYYCRTHRNLHSHTQTAPMTPSHYQVTGYGEVSFLALSPSDCTCIYKHSLSPSPSTSHYFHLSSSLTTPYPHCHPSPLTLHPSHLPLSPPTPHPSPLTHTVTLLSLLTQNGKGDFNDVWEVEVEGGRHGDRVKTVASVVKLRHVSLGCYLHSHGTQLPKWSVLHL